MNSFSQIPLLPPDKAEQPPVNPDAAPGSGELAEAARELTRLLNLPQPVPPELVLYLFGNLKKYRKFMHLRGETEVRAFIAGVLPAPSPRQSQELIASALNAFWRWVRHGFGIVGAQEYAQRLRACAACPDYVEAPQRMLYAAAKLLANETRICRHCGCFMSKKARYASESCPVSDPLRPDVTRWGEPAQKL